HDLVAWHKQDAERVLELDGVSEGLDPLPVVEDEVAQAGAAPPPPQAQAAGGGEGTSQKAPTIRVGKPTVDELLDIIRQLVLNKNRVKNIASELRTELHGATANGGLNADTAHLAAGVVETLSARADEYARLVGRLQDSITDTRVQPIDRLFERFQRIIRDVASVNDKLVELTIVGEQTRVDKFVLDQIVDPLARVLRYLGSSSIELPAERAEAGKPETGRIELTAEDRGSHVVITCRDDGRGIDPDDLRASAAAAGLRTPEELDAMPDAEIVSLALHRAMEHSELGGLAEALAPVDGQISIATEPGAWLEVQIALPIKAAVIPAMLLLVGDEPYALPLSCVHEIVRCADVSLSTVKGRELVRVRESVTPVVDTHALLGLDRPDNAELSLVILSSSGQAAAITVDRVLGHQEIVIEPTGLDANNPGPFLGATIRDDGSAALVLDPARLVRTRDNRDAAPTARPTLPSGGALDPD
ncbi:MAG: chemotaxis protein CheW, partial [Planctomycetota bacterium]